MLGKGKSVILSFDDGPAPVGALGNILTTLRKNAIIAEFYVLGSEVKKFPDETKIIVNRGHKIHNHSWSHPDLKKAEKEVVQSELNRTQKIIKETTGAIATKIRPPYGAGGWPGKYDPELSEVADALSLTIQNWDIDTRDWQHPRGIGPKKLKIIEEQFVRQRRKTRLNILMHVQDATARDLPSFISKLKDWKFTFAKP